MAERACWWELLAFAAHSHPSVAAMARTLMSGQPVVSAGAARVGDLVGTCHSGLTSMRSACVCWVVAELLSLFVYMPRAAISLLA